MAIISGHNFQYSIEDRIKAMGWKTFPEQSYLDDVELKPRDIDIIALKKQESHNPRGNQIALVVECKFLNHDVSCYLRQNPKDEKAYFIDGYNKEDLFVNKEQFHFFRTSTVVTNIIKEKSIKDNMGGALTQSIKALLYLRGSGRILDSKGLFFPVVVYGGKSKIYDQDNNELKNFLYYRTYEWCEPHSQNKVETRYIYVDVIREDNLEEYFEKIFEKEIDILINYSSFSSRTAERKERNLRNPAR